MRHTKTFLTIAHAALMGVALTSYSAVAAAESKIASIRSAELVLKSPQYKASQDKMKQEFEKRGKEFEAEAKKFEEDLKKFQKEADLLSGADRANRQKELETRKIDLGYKQQQLQQDMQNRSQQLEKDMRAKIQTVIEQLAQEKGFDLVLQDPVFASPAVDITGDVLKKLGATK
jgi:outer membrane protein